MINPDLIFEDLKAQATKQQARSLTLLNEVLKAHCKARERNFSIAEVARRSVAAGGPSESTIRNKTGLCFRQLIEAWASSVGAAMKMPVNPAGRSQKAPSDNELIRLIDDPALRTSFTQILAERNRFLAELNILKAQKTTIVDRRPQQNVHVADSNDTTVQLIPALAGVLTEFDITALKDAISEDFFSRQGWQVTATGQVKDNSGEIYKRGYVKAIQKILRELSHGD